MLITGHFTVSPYYIEVLVKSCLVTDGLVRWTSAKQSLHTPCCLVKSKELRKFLIVKP